MCRPVDGSREAACPGGHIGPPLHNAGNVPEITESGVENEHFPSGAGRSPPPTGGAEQGGLRRGAPGVWLPPVKFRNGIWGVSHGHPALRVQRRWYPAKGRCGHRPLRKGEKVSSTTRASGAQRSVCASGCEEMGGNCGKDHPQRGYHLGQSLSQPAADSSLCTREPWGRGMRISASARWASSQLQWSPVIPRSGATWESVPFYDGRGFGPPRSSAPTPRGGRGNGTPGSSCPTGGRREVSSIAGAALSEAESAERAAGQIRSLPDDLRAQHGVLGSEV